MLRVLCLQKSDAVTWRLIPIHISLRRRRAVLDNPASPARSPAYVETDYKPDVAPLASQATAINHAAVYPGDLTLKCATTMDESSLDTKLGRVTDSTTNTQLEYVCHDVI